MNRHVKNFLLRGIMFGGFGPIVLGIVYAVLQKTLTDFSLSGSEVLLGILSTYILAFMQAGATALKGIEHWSTVKVFAIHLSLLYLVYVLAYLVNAWIPFEPMFLLIFTAVFLLTFLAVWLSVYFTVKAIEKRINAKLS